MINIMNHWKYITHHQKCTEFKYQRYNIYVYDSFYKFHLILTS